MGRAGCPGLSFLSQPEVSLMSCGLAMSYFLESVVKAVKAGRLNSAERCKDNKVRLYTNDANLLFYEKNMVQDRFSF